MVFPASIQTKADALDRVHRTAARVKRDMQRYRDRMAAGDVSWPDIMAVLNTAREGISEFNDAASVDGIGEYAKAQYGDSDIDIVAEFNSMVRAATSVRDWIIANVPRDGDGFLLVESFDGEGAIIPRMFTPAQTEPLRTEIDGLIATIG